MPNTNHPAPAIAFQHVTVRRGALTILDSLNATIPSGSCTAIIGPNGAGKTSAIMTMLGEIPHQGKIVTDTGQETASLRIGFVPQKLDFDRTMPLTVAEFLAMGIQAKPLWLGISRRTAQHIEMLLNMVKADHLRKRRLGGLSGGELQRILLALALQKKPELLILDEPSAGVDFQGERLFCSLLEELRKQQGFTLVMVSHDLGMVACHATHVICLKRRCIAEGSPHKVLQPATLTELFGVHMGSINPFLNVPSACEAHCHD